MTKLVCTILIACGALAACGGSEPGTAPAIPLAQPQAAPVAATGPISETEDPGGR